MPIVDVFSKRQKKIRGEQPDVYVYDELPGPFRVQVVHIMRDLLGTPEWRADSNPQWSAFKWIVEALCCEYGTFALHEQSRRQNDYATELFNFLVSVEDVEQALDVIELGTRFADRCTREYEYMNSDSFKARVDDSIGELNARFREHGIGFQYEAGELARVAAPRCRRQNRARACRGREALPSVLASANQRRHHPPETEREREHRVHARRGARATDSGDLDGGARLTGFCQRDHVDAPLT